MIILSKPAAGVFSIEILPENEKNNFYSKILFVTFPLYLEFHFSRLLNMFFKTIN